MADTPVPRSYQSILSDMIDTFLTKYGIKSLKVGGPLLTLMEAAAQSDLRSTQDVFNGLNSSSLDQATGQALLRIAKSENIVPLKLTKANGLVNFGDSSFQKVSTNIYQGSFVPVIGTTALKISNASGFTPQGKLYIGRNTANYEGPISYTSVVNNGSYWTITLATGTTKNHNLGESVILAQGGDRIISAGTVVQTPKGAVSDPVQFNVLYSQTLLDGENVLNNVEVIAQLGGTVGNVPAKTINTVVSASFNGATVTNPLPFTNGTDAEDEDSLRERIRNARQSRQKATSLAINQTVKGVSSSVDNKTVVSSQILNPQSANPVLVIDDGTGYEEAISGVAQETLVDLALGGEQFFELSSPRPIAKASVTTTLIAPFQLTDGSQLSVNIGGILSTHIFNASEFKVIGNATAYEVVGSINGDSSLLWNARTSDNGTRVTLFAKSEANEDIQVVTNPNNDANLALVFPTSRVYTLKLYTDKLLNKDGQSAFLNSNQQATWLNTIQSGDTLVLSVDNTASQTITILDSDFSNLQTGFNTVNTNNTLASWATVLNSKIIGATAAINSGVLTLTSNLGANSRAALNITGGTLVAKGMFNTNSVTGSESDYTLNRNTGQIELAVPLVAGQSLTASSSNTNAFIESSSIPSATISLASAGNLWIVPDSQAKILKPNVSSVTSFTITNPATNRARYTATNNSFGTGTTAYIQPNDWVVIWDPSFTDKGAYRIAEVDTTNWAWFDIERNTVTTETATPAFNGMVFVRTEKQLQTITIPIGTYSLQSIVDTMNPQLIGCQASVFKTNYIKLTTNTSEDYGDIIVITADQSGQLLHFATGDLSVNEPSHFAVMESGNSTVGTPHFKWTKVATVPTSDTFTGVLDPNDIDLSAGDLLRFRKSLDSTSFTSYGQNANAVAKILSVNGNIITPRLESDFYSIDINDRYYATSGFKFGSSDNLILIVDGDEVSKTFDIPLYKSVKPDTGSVYGSATFNIVDANLGSSLVQTFGNDFSFNDFSLLMKARGKSHSITSNKTILWRYSRFGSEGESTGVRFTNPNAPNQGWGITTDTSGPVPFINLSLPSGASKTGLNLSGNNYFVIGANTVFDFPGVITVNRTSNVVTLTTAYFDSHNLNVGDVIYKTTTEANFPPGPKVISAISANSFSYNETGADATTGGYSYVVPKLPSGQKNTITAISSSGTTVTITSAGHPFSVGDTVYFLPGHQDGVLTIASGAKTVTAVTATTVSWDEGISQTGSATLVAGVPYTLSYGQCVKVSVNYYKASVNTTTNNLNRTSNLVTVKPETSALVSHHPFKIGDVVYLTPGEANFPAGPKLITYADNTKFKYIEPGLDGNATVLQFFSSTSTDPNFTGGSTPVVIGDIVHIDSNTLWDSNIQGEYRVNDVSSTIFSFLIPDTNYAGESVPSKINATNNLLFYPIDSALATAASAVSFANTTTIVSGTLVPANGDSTNNGSGVIDRSTEEEFLSSINNASVNGSGQKSVEYWTLFDGINWVQSTTLATTSGVSLKNTISGELSTNNDFANETMKLVPNTIDNIVDYLNNTASSGFVLNGTAISSDTGRKLQLSSNTIGSTGAVQVTSGLGNLTTATVVGSGAIVYDLTDTATYGKCLFPTDQLDGFTGNIFVSIQNSVPTVKNTSWGSTNTITIANGITSDESLISFDTNVITLRQQLVTQTYQIEKHGDFLAYVNNSSIPTALSANIVEGDWVYIDSVNFNVKNTGIFQVVRTDVDSNTFWIENPNGIEEVSTLGASDTIRFISYDSAVVGDTLTINTPIVGTLNIGNFTIKRFYTTGTTLNTTQFYVNGSMQPIGPITLWNDYSLVKLKETEPIRLIKKIRSIIPETESNGYSSVVFDTYSYINKITSSNGAIMTALDKLEFDTGLVTGTDGYSYNTGLLSEVNKVIYGDEANPTVYPGVVAAGTNLNITGPLIRRIQVSLALRLRNNNVNLIDRVKNSVAAFINSVPTGTAIAISDIIDSAVKIDGVISVSVLSPIYNTANDLIFIQANEKPRVLNIDEDISISIVGE